MKLRRYNEQRYNAKEISWKRLKTEREALSKVAQRISIATVDQVAYDLLETEERITFKIGFGATEKVPVSLRNLSYAVISLALAKEFEGAVEFVSGAGISSSCGIIRYNEIEEQVQETFRLIRIFSKICFPGLEVRFSIPKVENLEVIDELISQIERDLVYGREALRQLAINSRTKGKTPQQGKQYGVLHAFAFDLSESRNGPQITIGNEAEDEFNCVRYGVLQKISENLNINGRIFFPPSKSGHLITARCKLPPYAKNQLNGYELLPDIASIAKLEEIQKCGRSLRQQENGDVGTAIKDLEFLIQIVGLPMIKDVIDQFQQGVEV